MYVHVLVRVLYVAAAAVPVSERRSMYVGVGADMMRSEYLHTHMHMHTWTYGERAASMHMLHRHAHVLQWTSTHDGTCVLVRCCAAERRSTPDVVHGYVRGMHAWCRADGCESDSNMDTAFCR